MILWWRHLSDHDRTWLEWLELVSESMIFSIWIWFVVSLRCINIRENTAEGHKHATDRHNSMKGSNVEVAVLFSQQKESNDHIHHRLAIIHCNSWIHGLSVMVNAVDVFLGYLITVQCGYASKLSHSHWIFVATSLPNDWRHIQWHKNLENWVFSMQVR